MKKFLFALGLALGFSTAAMAYQCSYEIVAGPRGGRVLDVITVGSDISPAQACTKARVACEGMLRSRYSNIRNAACVQAFGGWNPRPAPRPIPAPRYVTRSCTARLIERGYYGDFQVQSFYATISGMAGTGLKQRACDEARRDCEYNRRFNQFCVVDR